MVKPRTIKLVLAATVWFAAEALLQIHGWQFWQQHGGWNGGMWSVVLCVATVWFWLHHRRSIRYTFGVLASVLLLAGPLWQVGAPLVDAVEKRDAQQRNVVLQMETLRNSETLQVATLQTFLRNSEARTGWAPLIVAAQDDLATTRSRIADTTSTPPAARAAFLSVAVIVIQLATLVVLQVAAVAALLVIRCVPVAAVQPEQEVAVKDRVPQSSSKEIKRRIAAGNYGQKPSMRSVITGEKMKHAVVHEIFHDLVADGILVAVGNRFRLAVLVS